MAELERLQVRIVAGRRSSNEMRVAKAAQAGLTGGRASAPTGFGAASARGSLSGAVASVQPTYSLLNDIAPSGGTAGNVQVDLGGIRPGSGLPRVDSASGLSAGSLSAGAHRRDSLGAYRRDSLGAHRRDSLGALLSAADIDRRNSLGSLGFGANLMSMASLDHLPQDSTRRARRNSSLDLVSFLKNEMGMFEEGAGGGTGADMGSALGSGPAPHRPLVGGGAAAAYEAARADHYRSLADQKEQQGNLMRQSGLRASLGLGGGMNCVGRAVAGPSTLAMGGKEQVGVGPRAAARGAGMSGAIGAMSGLGPNATPSQHYEMLKLHHMNLLQEIQETTMMMNIYQQQMIQEQQSALRQSQMHNNNGGNGGIGGGGSIQKQHAQQTEKTASAGASRTNDGSSVESDPVSGSAASTKSGAGAGDATTTSAAEINRLKEEIAEKQKMMEKLRQQSENGKHGIGPSPSEPEPKRQR